MKRSTAAAAAAGALATTLLWAMLLATDGCFAVAELDRYHLKSADAGLESDGVEDLTQPSSLVLTLINMGVHFQQYIEARVIDSENSIQSLVMIKPLDELGKDRITIRVPGAIPRVNQPYRLDFYADVNGSGTFDGIGNVLIDDHAWRIEPLADFPSGSPHVPNVIQVSFLHSKSFTDISRWPTGQGPKNPPVGTGLGARVAFTGSCLGPYLGRLLQIRIEETRTGHTVATYRAPQIGAPNLVAEIPGVLDIEADYEVKIYIDANGNSHYDSPAQSSPSPDLGYVLPIRSSVHGAADGGAEFGIDAVLDLAHTDLAGDADVGEP
jgi:hypothetical protein